MKKEFKYPLNLGHDNAIQIYKTKLSTHFLWPSIFSCLFFCLFFSSFILFFFFFSLFDILSRLNENTKWLTNENHGALRSPAINSIDKSMFIWSKRNGDYPLICWGHVSHTCSWDYCEQGLKSGCSCRSPSFTKWIVTPSSENPPPCESWRGLILGALTPSVRAIYLLIP